MTIKQLSVFIENKKGAMLALAELLRKNQIDVRAMSVADTKDFGILRLIVDDSYKASCMLKDEGYIFSITKVIAVAMSDKSGSMLDILKALDDEDINIEYMYAFTARKKDCAYMVLRVDDLDKAKSVLPKHGIKLICQENFSEI